MTRRTNVSGTTFTAIVFFSNKSNKSKLAEELNRISELFSMAVVKVFDTCLIQ